MDKNEIKYTGNFNKIITFFLFECPIKGVSHRGKTFKEIGWHGSSRFQMLERLLKTCTIIDDCNWVLCDKTNIVTKLDNICSLCYIVCNNDIGRVQSIIYAIRCSFAHGSFDIKNIDGDNIYYLENHYKGNLKAKIVIEESALLKWIRIIKTNPEFLTKRAIKKQEKERKKHEQTNQ